MKKVRDSNKKLDRKRLASCAAVCVVASVASAAAGASTHLHQSSFESPLGFERNDGQTDSRVDFVSRGQGYALFLTSTEMVLSLQSQQREGAPAKSADAKKSVADVVRMQLSGAAKAKAEGVDLLPSKVNYLKGSDQKQWRVNVPVYKAVKYASVYPGVDVVYYGKGRELEYDFVVAPGADPKAIELSFSGANVDVDAKGNLVLAAKGGEVRLHKPVVYQLDGDRRVEVAGNYVREGSHAVKFEVGAYDRNQPLVIDPILSYSTYLGGTGQDQGFGIAVDAAGSLYVGGITTSADFPGNNPQPKGDEDGFIAKLSKDGRTLEYATYIGGKRDDVVADLEVNAAGEAYLVGRTWSDDFPLVGPIDAIRNIIETFVLKLNADGATIAYSTFIGGSKNDEGRAIDLDSEGAAYVVGKTDSTDFPVVHAFQANPGRPDGEYADAFLTKINPAGSAFVYSTYLGGEDRDDAYDVAVDADGSAYVVGDTQSSDFPTQQPLHSLTKGRSDGFVAKFTPTGEQLAYSTYLGGSASDSANAIDVDAKGAAYVAGETRSLDFPMVRAFQPKYAGGQDAFLVKLLPTGAGFEYATYLGGGATYGSDAAYGVAVDPSGAATVVGQTRSANFPQKSRVQLPGEDLEAFVTRFEPDGQTLAYSTYLGGDSDDSANRVAVDTAGNAYITGRTESPNFLTLKPLQAALRGHSDVFVTKLINLSFAGVPGKSNCAAQSESQLARQHSSLTAAAAALNFESVQTLQDEIQKFCREQASGG